MVFELLNARMSHFMQIQVLVRLRMKKTVRDAEKAEKELEHLEAEYEKYYQEGLADEVESIVLKRVKEGSKHLQHIIRQEENHIVNIYREFMKLYKQLHNTYLFEKQLESALGKFPVREREEVEKTLREIAELFKQEANETYDYLLQFARAFRDQYEAIVDTEKGKVARERLREMILGSSFQSITANLKVRGANKALKRLKGDVKVANKEINLLHETLNRLDKSRDPSRLSKEIKVLQSVLEKEKNAVSDEEKQISEFFKDTRIFIFLFIKHYFILLGHMLKEEQDELRLEQDEFPKDLLQKILNVQNHELSDIEQDGRTLMRESYQLFHKMEDLKKEAAQAERAV